VRTPRVIAAYYRGNEVELRLECVEPTDADPFEWGTGYNLIIAYHGANILIPLGEMTHEELTDFGDILALAIQVSKPVAAMRDLLANEAVKSGDSSFARLYRGVPNVVVPEGFFRTHLERVRERRERVLPGPRPDADPGVRPGGRGGGLDEHKEAQVGTEDDATKDDGPA
jgi:hypothetical protein